MSERVRQHEPGVSAKGTAETRYQKVSITVPEPLLEQVRQRVGERGLSHYVARALEHEERRVALDEWLSDMDREHGPVPHEVMEEVRREWPTDPVE